MSDNLIAALGFVTPMPGSWSRIVRGREVVFRRLVTLAELTPLEALQREVMGVTDLDVMPANGLIVIPETGGAIITAVVAGNLAGALWGFGGFVNGRPLIVSDWMGVRPAFRSLGLGAELKRLQAALALAAGFELIVWTVDPLRAANAWLNVAKLGATSRRYEVDRYGAYAEGLYGTMPTDRLHMDWELRDPAVLTRLHRGSSPTLGGATPSPAGAEVPDAHLLLPIPPDIDGLVKTDPSAALNWRLRVRDQLQAAFAAGYVLDGFRAGHDMTDPTYVLTRKERR